MMDRRGTGIPTWQFELALRVKHHVFGEERFEAILARADKAPPGWRPDVDHEYITALLANEVLWNDLGQHLNTTSSDPA